MSTSNCRRGRREHATRTWQKLSSELIGAGFSGQTVIDRRDFGLTWNQALEAGAVLVGTDVRISIELEAVHRD